MSPVVAHGRITFRELVARVKADRMKAYRELDEPQLDAVPRCWFYRDETLHTQAIPPWAFNSREMKDRLVQFFVTMIGVGNCSMFAWSTVQWLSPSAVVNLDALTPEQRAAVERNELPEGHKQPSEYPDRIEQLAVHVYDREIYEGHFAEIKRPKKGSPRLGKWNDFDERVAEIVGVPANAAERGVGWAGGLMIDPIREALR